MWCGAEIDSVCRPDQADSPEGDLPDEERDREDVFSDGEAGHDESFN
jgi:hypothetical protein